MVIKSFFATTLLIVACLLLKQGTVISEKNCGTPPVCLCSEDMTNVTCMDTSLTFIPDLPATALRVKISDPKDRRWYPNYKNTIPPRAFSNLSKLESLDLSWSFIATFVHSSFEGLDSLTHLDLSFNRLTTIPTRALSKLSHLQRLDLSYNFISFIITPLPPRAFSELSNLQSLDLSWNYIETFDPLTFEGLNSLTHLDLSFNCLQIIPTQALSKLPNLKRLNLSWAGILSTIWMRNHLYNYVHRHNGHEELRLNFSCGCINTIYRFAFEGLDGLTDLDLSTNNISIIQTQAFSNLPRLKHLNLSNNFIKKIETKTFSGTESISEIHLKGNLLSEVPSIGSQPQLSFLDLSDNMITDGTFPPTYIDSKGNLTIDLSENIFLLYSTDFSALAESTMVDLRLSGNQRLVFPTSKSLTVPHKFQFTTNLQNLYMDNCKIVLFNSDFPTPLISLRVLDLSDNLLYAVWWPFFKSMPYLQTLDLENNNLGKTRLMSFWGREPLFSELKTLEQLFISNNNIVNITDTTFKDLVALKVLNISNNRISGWGSDVFRFSNNIVKLDLSFNRLSFLTEDNLKDLINLQELFLNGNNFICSCDLLWFREWIDNTNVTLPDKELYTCHGPAEWRGKPVLEFTKNNCTKSFISYTNIDNIVGAPVPVSTIIGALATAVFIGLISGVLMYKNRWRIRLRIYLLTKRGRLFVETQREREQRGNEGDQDYYDAYISCCEQDYDWALHHLLPDVDNGGSDNGRFGGNFKLYFDARDKDIGTMAIANIFEHMTRSKNVIVVLTENYIIDGMNKFELDQATTLYNDGDLDGIIVIKVGDVSARNVPAHLYTCMRRGEYIEWDNDEVAIQQFKEQLKDKLSADTSDTMC